MQIFHDLSELSSLLGPSSSKQPNKSVANNKSKDTNPLKNTAKTARVENQKKKAGKTKPNKNRCFGAHTIEIKPEKQKRKYASMHDRVQEMNKTRNYESYPLSWKNVIFKSNYIYLCSPFTSEDNVGLRIEWRGCSPVFEYIKDVFIDSQIYPQVRIRSGNILYLHNLDEIQRRIVTYAHKVLETEKIKFKSGLKRGQLPAVAMPHDRASRLPQIRESVYLTHLSHLHHKTYKVYYCLETKNNTWADAAPEHAFLLTIRASNDRLLAIYENTMDSRSSVLFEFKKSKSIRAFDCISSFFACNIQNKREKLMNAEIEFPKDLIIGYRRVIHNTETQWKSDIAASIMDFINNRF